MIPALIIVFREIIEAGLIIGIVLAATRGIPRRGFWITGGVMGGVLGACLVAAFASTISNLMEGNGQELFNVGILLTAAVMLTWHNVWMARHGHQIAMEMKTIGEAVAHGQRSLTALAVVVGIAVLREGSEIVLFLYGIAVSGTDTVSSMIFGGALGIALGIGISAVTYLGLLRIPNRYLFTVTGWLLALLAAGMVAQAIAFLQQAGFITLLSNVVWDTSAILSNGSIAGKVLHTLVGYTDRPTGMQLIGYAAMLIVIFVLMRLFGHAPHRNAKPLPTTQVVNS